MKLHITKSKHYTQLYVVKSVRINGQSRNQTIEKLGTTESIMTRECLNDEASAIEWAKQYVARLNEDIKLKRAETKITFHPNMRREVGSGIKEHIGYIFLQKIYYNLGLNLICNDIQKRHKVKYDINHILQSLVYTRIISPSSKVRNSEDVKQFYNWQPIELNQVYRTLSVLAKEINYIQPQLFKNSDKLTKRKTGVLYYDCSNFFYDIEHSSGLRQYGCSKENRPNPIVEFGLFMDRGGIPLAFCVHGGNKSESQTMIPLEKKIVDEFKLSNFVVCTATSEIKVFNSTNNRHFIVVQSIKKLSKQYKQWALSPEGWQIYVERFDDETAEEKEIKDNIIKQKKVFNIAQIKEEDYYDTIFYNPTLT